MKSLYKFLITITLLACSRDKVDFLGPAYISAPDGFAVTSFTATPSPVDFTSTTAGIVNFNATFTNKVTWILTLTGQKSGAVHTIQETTNGFANLLWKGNSDGVIFFRTGETVTATLSFFGTSLTSTATIIITKAPDYTTCGSFPRYGDFENAVKVDQPYWNRFNSAGASQGVDSAAIDYKGNVVPSVEGKNYYFIKGLGAQATFVDGIQYIKGFGPPVMPIPATPDNVWVNIYIYGTGDANTQVDVEYQEADAGGIAGYQPTQDDAWVAHIIVNHVGWKLFSFRYSDLVPSANAAFGGSGNKIHEPATLQSFDLILLKIADPNSAIEVYFDYPIITVGGPFKPCK